MERAHRPLLLPSPGVAPKRLRLTLGYNPHVPELPEAYGPRSSCLPAPGGSPSKDEP